MKKPIFVCNEEIEIARNVHDDVENVVVKPAKDEILDDGKVTFTK